MNPSAGIQTTDAGSSETLSAKTSHRPQNFGATQILAVIAIGLGIGWLAGLSMSPVVSGLIASLMALASGVVIALRGVKMPNGKSLVNDARPLALLVVGVALGATGGVAVRAHDLLAPRATSGQAQQQGASQDQPFRHSVLFSVPGKECSELRTVGAERIRFVFRSSTSERIRSLGEQIEDPRVLKTIAEVLCADGS